MYVEVFLVFLKTIIKNTVNSIFINVKRQQRRFIYRGVDFELIFGLD